MLWGLNVIIHLVLFAGTARLIKRKLSLKRLFIVSVIGSCSIFIVLTPFELWLVHPLGKVLLSIVLVFAAFGFPSLFAFLQSLFMFYVMSFLAAGTITAIETMRFSLQHREGFLSEYAASMYSSFSIILIVFSLPVLWLTFKWTDNTTKARKMQWSKLATVTIKVENTTWKGEALIDTGNQLKDPVTRSPVMVMQISLLRKELPEEQFKQLETMLHHKRIEDLEYVTWWEGRWRLVPYRTAGQNMQMMFALKPDLVTVQFEEKQIDFDTILVGLESQSLSSNEDFQMIIPSDPLQASAHESA
ncbi:sigma-E processing peptidase SpoIIGA [Alteribacillus sp. YIM 98480]|uniref:sigma-E processing peptidase SpoIIGA n=1 Tax=Alteribacillus sp. YIM 98480 TaxID=2606599 RepID=UPI00131E6C34|nr:sigma-E processing peptidase SpoIIGA [Alteribacillus sp. YIM 98480]